MFVKTLMAQNIGVEKYWCGNKLANRMSIQLSTHGKLIGTKLVGKILAIGIANIFLLNVLGC